MRNFIEMINERLSVCENCEHYRKITKQCKLCGCFMPLKTSIESASCPDKKWN